MSAPLASRSGVSHSWGKRTESAKTLLAQPTKEALQKRAMEIGMSESELIAVLIESAVHGPEHVRTVTLSRIERALGIVHEPAHDNPGTGTQP